MSYKYFVRLFFTFTIASLLSGNSAFAQVTDSTDFDFSVEDNPQSIASFDLAGCIKYAIRYSEALKKAQLTVRTAHATIGENLAKGLPQLSADGSFTDNFKVQTSFFPIQFFDPTDESGKVIPIKISPKYSGNTSINFSQLIFDASYFIGLKAARMYEDVQRRQMVLTEIDIAESVAKSFYAVLISRERLTLIEQNYRRLDTLLKETRALNENGFAEQIEVMRTEVAFNNIQTEKKKALGAVVLTEQLLKFQMGMPLSDSLILSGDLTQMELNEQVLLDTEPDFKSRIEYNLLEKNKELQYVNLKYNKSIYYPSLTGVVSYGFNSSNNQFSEMVKFGTNWFGYGYWGLRLNIPILDGFKRRHTLEKVRIEIEKIEQDQKIFERQTNIQATQYKTVLAESIYDMSIQKRNMELAKEVVRVSKIKYTNGVGSNKEVIDAETDYKTAETNYYAALYQAIINKVDLDKALGRIMQEYAK